MYKNVLTIIWPIKEANWSILFIENIVILIRQYTISI